MNEKKDKKLEKQKKLEKFLQKKLQICEKKVKPPQKKTGYDHTCVERKWMDAWMSANKFGQVKSTKKYVICMPPPNVTGSLHTGHALMLAIQDSLCRYKRLQGYEVLYLPGTDHAGIATQTVVLKQLESKKEAYDREKFIKATWEWKEKYGDRILNQFKRMGTSADFSRQRFTLDTSMNKAVVEAFCRLYEKGLIYRENKIVNWCGKLQTTLSDIEIDHVEVKPNTVMNVDGRNYEFGVIYVFKYPVKIKNEKNNICTKEDNKNTEMTYLKVATTRPETILGDTALCVHPADDRYREYVKETHKITPINPITGAKIKFITDMSVDTDMGCGVLKVTPAHDPVDFEIGKRHNLPRIKIFDNHNRICMPGEFLGMTRLEARNAVLRKLEQKGLFVEKKPHEHILPFCSRSGDLIEPSIKEQWWCKCASMAKKAIDVVERGDLEIYPCESKQDWYRWFENPRDWCLSRQLWWGHQIPAYVSPSGKWCVGRTKEEAIQNYYNEYDGEVRSQENVAQKIDSEVRETQNDNSDNCEPVKNERYKSEDFVQDEDVLDTWFSSGLWPFATLGWPDNTEDFSNYFPTTILETGKDILFFWVGRMVMLSNELTGQVPFKKVLLHGIVRDANGRKMSKSLGNVLDPIHVIDGVSLNDLINEMKSGNLGRAQISAAEAALKLEYPNGIQSCGADALRFALLSYVNGVNDIKLDMERVKGYRKFCNKLWNGALFVKKTVDDYMTSDSTVTDYSQMLLSAKDLKNEQDHFVLWLVQKRNKMISDTMTSLEDYNFMNAVQAIHQFFLYSFCDVCIEIIKQTPSRKYVKMLYTVFIDCLQVFSIYMPFISEEIYHKFSSNFMTDTSFPEIFDMNVENEFNTVLNLVKTLRIDIDKLKTDVKVTVTKDQADEWAFEHIKALCTSIKDVCHGQEYAINKYE